MRYVRNSSAALAVALGVIGCSSREDDVVPAEIAREYLNKTCVIELVVKSSKHEAEKNLTYLDSESDYRNPKNLAVVIADADLQRFREKVEDPSSYYRGKVLRVTGKVVFHDDQYQVNVTNPTQIKIISTR